MNSNQFIADLLTTAIGQVPLVAYFPVIASLGLVALKAATGERYVAKRGLKVFAIAVASCLVCLFLGLSFTMGLIAGDPGGSVNFLSLLFLGLSLAAYVLMLPSVIYTVFFARAKG